MSEVLILVHSTARTEPKNALRS